MTFVIIINYIVFFIVLINQEVIVIFFCYMIIVVNFIVNFVYFSCFVRFVDKFYRLSVKNKCYKLIVIKGLML